MVQSITPEFSPEVEVVPPNPMEMVPGKKQMFPKNAMERVPQKKRPFPRKVVKKEAGKKRKDPNPKKVYHVILEVVPLENREEDGAPRKKVVHIQRVGKMVTKGKRGPKPKREA